MTEQRTQNPDDERLPGAVSDQNGEEQLPEHAGQETTRRPPGDGDGESSGDGVSSGGEAGEGSQSTGHPSSAG